MPFTHLHTHTEYSLLDGANRIKPLAKRLAELGYNDSSVSVQADGRLLVTPPSSMVDGHEFHFAIVRDEFLNMLASGKEPGGLRTQLAAKYKLMAMARDMALNK